MCAPEILEYDTVKSLLSRKILDNRNYTGLVTVYSMAAFDATVVGGMNEGCDDLIEIKSLLITCRKRACGDYFEKCD